MKFSRIIIGFVLFTTQTQGISISNINNNKPKLLQKTTSPQHIALLQTKSKTRGKDEDNNVQMDGMDDQQIGEVNDDPISNAISLLKSNQDQLNTIHQMVFAKQPEGLAGALALAKPPKVTAPESVALSAPVSTAPAESFAKYLDSKPEPAKTTSVPAVSSKLSVAALPKHKTNEKVIKASPKVPKQQEKADEGENKYADMFKPTFSDSLFATKNVVQKTLDKVQEQKNLKAHPFTGLFGASGGASDLFKTIEGKVDLPNSEFKAPVPAKVPESEEQKLSESLTSSILQGSNSNLLSSKLIKNDDKIDDMFKSIADAAKDLTDSLKKVEKSTTDKNVTKAAENTKLDAPVASKDKPIAVVATAPAQTAAPISLVTKPTTTFEVPKEKAQSLAIPSVIKTKAPVEIKPELVKDKQNKTLSQKVEEKTENQKNSSAVTQSKETKGKESKVMPVAKMTTKLQKATEVIQVNPPANPSPVKKPEHKTQELNQAEKKNGDDHKKSEDIPKHKSHWFKNFFNSISSAFSSMFSFGKH